MEVLIEEGQTVWDSLSMDKQLNMILQSGGFSLPTVCISGLWDCLMDDVVVGLIHSMENTSLVHRFYLF